MKSLLIRGGLSAAFIIPALLLSTAALATQGSDDDAVLSKGNQKVVSTSGNCVRTKWQVGTDVCATAKPAPAKVAQAPTPKIELEQRTIYFDFNKSGLTAAETAKLDKLVTIISHSKSITHATVIGYADVIGKESYNMILSQKRADTVEKYLASHVSIPTNTMVVAGKGTADPVTTCDTKMKRKKRIECLAQNRRVEIKFDYME